MKVGSLFSGIGGIDLGLERAGMSVRWQCETDDYCRRVLAKHWPDIPCYADAWTLPVDAEPVDLICGGYPCQPFSVAGLRGGEDDPRHLWPAFARALRFLRPEWALLENVPGHFSLGFGQVLGDLAQLGYDAEWSCVSASDVGAPHLRRRVFVVAYPNGQWQQQPGRRVGYVGRRFGDSGSETPANSDAIRQQRRARDERPGRGRESANRSCNGNPWTVEPQRGSSG